MMLIKASFMIASNIVKALFLSESLLVTRYHKSKMRYIIS